MIKKLLEKYRLIRNKVKKTTKKMFLVHNVKMHTNFYSRNKEPTKSIKEYKRDSPFSYCCIPAIVLQSACKWKKTWC